MATVQYLKKKLRGIRSTQKLSKAMKTAATVKYSRLSSAFSEYSEYENNCRTLYEEHSSEWTKSFPKAAENAPVCLVIIGSNKGMCGGFNAELAAFAENKVAEHKNCVSLVCGKQAIAHFAEKGLPMSEQFVFDDVPTLAQSTALIDRIYNGLLSGEFSAVKLIFSKYENMMHQVPTIIDLFIAAGETEETDSLLFIPDKQTVISGTLKTVISALIFRRVLETALGAQAATLMTMRSAYDTATELCDELEAEINRKRQSRVTADVLETAVEFTEETEV